MYLKKNKSKKTGRTHLYIADGYHDRDKGYTKTVTVQSLGYLDVLEKKYADPIAHFTEVVKQMNEEKKIENLSLNVPIFHLNFLYPFQPLYNDLKNNACKYGIYRLYPTFL